MVDETCQSWCRKTPKWKTTTWSESIWFVLHRFFTLRVKKKRPIPETHKPGSPNLFFPRMLLIICSSWCSSLRHWLNLGPGLFCCHAHTMFMNWWFQVEKVSIYPKSSESSHRQSESSQTRQSTFYNEPSNLQVPPESPFGLPCQMYSNVTWWNYQANVAGWFFSQLLLVNQYIQSQEEPRGLILPCG